MTKAYEVIRDKQEKANFWTFNKSTSCLKTTSETMDTGDYTLRGLESVFTIERKASTGEFAGNLPTKRFERELQRMEAFEHAYVICEFTMEDMYTFPQNSGIPKPIWRKLRVTSAYLIKRLVELESKYKVKFIFAGTRGKEVAKAIFKRMAEMYPDKIL